MWQIIGWIVWGMLALLAISFAFGCRRYTKAGQSFQWATGIQTLFFWAIAILFLVFDWNKLHILWVTPVAFLSAQFLVLGKIPILSSMVLSTTKIFLFFILIGVKKSNIDNIVK